MPLLRAMRPCLKALNYLSQPSIQRYIVSAVDIAQLNELRNNYKM